MNLTGQTLDTLDFSIGEYPPGVSEYLPGYGFFTEIVTEAFKAEGIEVNYSFCPWARVWLNITEGNSDGSLGYLWNPEREEEVLYSKPIWDMSFSAAFCLKEKTFHISKPDDLMDYKVIIQRGYSYGANVDQYLASDKIDYCVVETEEQAFKMLILNRAEFFLTNNLNGLYTIQTFFPEENTFTYYSYDPTLNGASFHMVVSKKHPRSRWIIERFNSGLEKIKSSGLFDEISADYLPHS
ncbi:transporter substrate-binding domain-containing protein [Spirochaeta isovalerica]|uniref:Polar amino acid transport system substrate-binding protein n=1 Tax=Spirochaeta isovalerica TaxID=150 RepID=A0A841R437_9SPIO|nr:polar amino acid transport system substrate-binding protein [Spirochaeta isovalerica]